jgi:hypothetical protein
MKDYGRNGRLKPEKKKKRKFEVIVNTATHGIYSDFTPMKVAKKVTSELVGKKKQIIFHLREKGKSGKTYGYIGNIRDGKVVVRTHKMSGGIGEPEFTNEEKKKLFAKNGNDPIKTIRKDNNYFVCFFGVLGESKNYQYFVYFSDTTRSTGIKFYKINPDNSFTEVTDLKTISNGLLISLTQSLESKKNKSEFSEKDQIIDMIIGKITEQIPNIKSLINVQKNIKELQSPNYINNTKGSCINVSPSIEDFKAGSNANILSFKRRKFCTFSRTILFFTEDKFIEYDGSNYFRFVIYGEWNSVKLEKLIEENGKLIKKKILIGEIRKETLERIKRKIEEIRKASINNKDIAKDILKVIDSAINVKNQETQKEKVNNKQKQQRSESFLALRPEIPKISQQTPNLYDKYKCEIQNPIVETLEKNSKIFFGFDIDLLKTQPSPATLYYKYSYNDGKFYKLDNGILKETELDIQFIPFYDLLCLYEFAKDKNLTDLMGKIKDHILKITDKTAPNSKETIARLNNSNFKINKNTNIGKIKGKVEIMQGKRKTYYFFGKLDRKYKYVCYREGEGNKEKVYYFDRNNIKEIKDLMDLQDRSALEDLKSFIILRRIKNPEDKEFGKGVYEKSSKRIGQLKFQEIQTIIVPSQTQDFSAQSPFQTPVQIPVQSPFQSQQFPVQSNGIFLKFFKSFVSGTQPLPSNKKPQLQSQPS